jgi:DNA ligase-associated metallophosphoesterase
MTVITFGGLDLHLLPEKAIYIQAWETLLASDIHLGKSETFQLAGIPISNQVNQQNLDRITELCLKTQAKQLYILGDLFHSKQGLGESLLTSWQTFVSSINVNVKLIIGNHDRRLNHTLSSLGIHLIPSHMELSPLILSHEPHLRPNSLNICGHIHPCVRIKTKLDNLRLPCFYFDSQHNLLILPSFGEFTGGYDLPLQAGVTAYVVADGAIVPFCG